MRIINTDLQTGPCPRKIEICSITLYIIHKHGHFFYLTCIRSQIKHNFLSLRHKENHVYFLDGSKVYWRNNHHIMYYDSSCISCIHANHAFEFLSSLMIGDQGCSMFMHVSESMKMYGFLLLGSHIFIIHIILRFVPNRSNRR